MKGRNIKERYGERVKMKGRDIEWEGESELRGGKDGENKGEMRESKGDM